MAKEEMKRIKILTGTTANGSAVRKDDVIDVPKNEAEFLIGQKLAEDCPKGVLKSNPKPKAPGKKGEPTQPPVQPPAPPETDKK